LSAVLYYPTTSTSPTIEASNSSAGDVLTYENSKYGVKMQYPGNWTTSGGNTSNSLTDVATFFSPTDSDGSYATITILVDDISGRGRTLSEYLDESINYYKTFEGFKFIASNTDKVLDGYPAYGLRYHIKIPYRDRKG
jgi:hypothetical protein